MLNKIFLQLPLLLTRKFFGLVTAITGKRFDLMFYHALGRSTKLSYQINGISFDASFKAPWLRGERLFSKEPETIHWINEMMQPGDILYDIGANIGVYSLYAVSRGLKVYAFEPESSSYAILNNNIKINSFDEQIKALNIALNDTNMISHLNISNFQPGKSGHSFDKPINQHGKEYVPEYKQACIGYRLDSLIHDFSLPVPNHIKIDVDGNEEKIIAGFGNLLNHSSLKSIMVEMNIGKESRDNIAGKILSFGFNEIEDKKYVNQEYLRAGCQNIFFVRRN